METRVCELTGATSGPLLLGASTTIAEFILPRILGEFKVEHPQVHAHLTVGNSEMIESRVADHALDLGLIESPSHLPGLSAEVCCEDELVLICAPEHKFAKAAAVKPRELAGEPFVSRELGSGTREFIDQYLQRCKVAPEDLNMVMELGSPEAIKGVVETGLGVSIVSRATVAKELKLATAGGAAARAAADPHFFVRVSRREIPFEAAHHLRRVCHHPHAQACQRQLTNNDECRMMNDEQGSERGAAAAYFILHSSFIIHHSSLEHASPLRHDRHLRTAP